MSRDPHDEVWIALECFEQGGLGDRRMATKVTAILATGRRLLRLRLRVGVHRDMGTDDHEFISVLTFLEFI